MEIEELKIIWKSDDEDSMVSATVGRVMATVLTARPTKLTDSISRLQSSPNPPNPLALSLENSLRILHKYVMDGAVKEESLDEILIPMIEHSLRSKDSKYKNQEMILLNWLFQDEVLFQALARNFSSIVLRKEDHHIALGWCILARRLIEYDVTMSRYSVIGIKERYTGLLENLTLCSGHLLSLINSGSTLQGGFELPTRLSVAAADCVISLSVALTRKEMVIDTSKNMKKSSKFSEQELGGQKKVKQISQTSEITKDMEMRFLLWNLVDQLIVLVQRLLAWSKKSRSLHAKGLERVLKWLHETKKQYPSSQDQADQQMVKTGMLLLSSCWKHYGILLHLEDHQLSNRFKELLEQYLSGIEYYAGDYTKEHADDRDSGISTINFFLNCLLLLLGRFTSKQFDTAMTEHRLHISRVVSSQLCSADDDVIDGAVSILKAMIFGTNHITSGSSLTDSKQMNSVLPLLLNLLDERDGTSRAAVTLIAEYCSMSTDNYCLGQILKRLSSENITQRRNALDVLSEVINISSDSASVLSHSVWQDIANHLLDCLNDEEDIIRSHATKLLTLIDPSSVLPALVRLIYSSDSTLYSSATSTLLGVLTYHNHKPEVVSMVLDCLSNLNASLDHQKSTGSEGLKGDMDKVLKLIPEWSKSVKNWKLLVGPLIDKMFADPSNPIIVKFLSYISDYLGGVADIVFQRILLHTESQTEIDESFLSELDISCTVNDAKLQQSLFARLCPLLILRLLPLKVFNDHKSSLVYGDLLNQNNDTFDISDTPCIAALLLKRAFTKLEFEDVRKLSAELCGRLHPIVLFPVVSSKFERATNDHDILKIKACLFSVCTSLVVRGMESVGHPGMSRIKVAIETVLLWPSTDGDEIAKAQHGCIDCLAIAVCTEFQDPKLSRNVPPSREKRIIQNGNSDSSTFQDYVLDHLTCDDQKLMSSNWDPLNTMSKKELLSFRLCMANALISACQKISDSGKRPFALKVLQRITRSIYNVKEPELRAACIQVLFSTVYHLKAVVLPYSSDLLKASLQSLKRGSEMERIGGAKLLASLMASDEMIVRSISQGLLEARILLSTISQTDSSTSVRQLCSQLLACMTSA